MGRTEKKILRANTKENKNSVSSEFSNDWGEWLSESAPVTKSVKTKVTSKLTHKTKVTPKKHLDARPNLEDMPYEDRPLSPKQERFCQFYIEDCNGEQAAIKAGYSENTAASIASENLKKPNVAKRIRELKAEVAKPHIATGEQVMQFFSDVMNGKIKDQFNLEASLSDRTKAAVELAKRTIDLDNKLAGKADATVEIKLDWKRD